MSMRHLNARTPRVPSECAVLTRFRTMSYHTDPGDHTVQRLLAELILPNAEVAVTPMAGDHSNGVHLITVDGELDAPIQLVLKIYANPVYDRDVKARREFRAREMLHDAHVPRQSRSTWTTPAR